MSIRVLLLTVVSVMVSNAVKIQDDGEGKEEAKTDDDDLQMVMMGYPKGMD
jgi:hypothetical protein